MRALVLTLGVLAVAGCGGPSVYVTSLGPLRVDDLPQIPVTGDDGLVAETLRGDPVPFEARDAAREAMEAYCLDQHDPGTPHFFGWRTVDGRSAWTAMGCTPIPFGDPAIEPIPLDLDVEIATTVPDLLIEALAE